MMSYSTASVSESSVSVTEGESLRRDLFLSLEGSSRTRPVLERMMELSGAESCAFYSAAGEGSLYILLKERGLSSQVPYISDKVLKAYHLFSNSAGETTHYREEVYYRRPDPGCVFAVGDASIESYFLVPVIRSSGVHGVVFLGSVRRDAFTRREIEIFNRLAGEDSLDPSVVYRVAGEAESAMNLVSALPFGAALISMDGRIIFHNRLFAKELGLQHPESHSLMDIRSATGYDLPALWDELKLSGENIPERVVKSSNPSRPLIQADWTRAENVSDQVDTVLIVQRASTERRKRFQREDVLSMAAHEIRTPLSALKNSLRILEEEGSCRRPEAAPAGGKPVPADSMLATAIRTAEKLDLIVDGLVAVSPAGSKRLKLDVAKTGSRLFFESACGLYRKIMEKRELELHFDISEELPSIEIDRHRIEQVIHNLLSNSLKKVTSGDEIKISLSRVNAPENSIYSALSNKKIFQPRLMEIVIEDSGEGFPAPVIEYVNGLAEAAEQKRSPRYGLGLYIASGLVRLHGGLMRIGNRERGGAVCRVVLPADAVTRHAVMTLMDIGERIEEEAVKGRRTRFYLISKESGRCWLEILGKWDSEPLVNPDRDEVSERGLYFWPLGKDTAAAVAAGEGYSDDPSGLIRADNGLPRLIRGGSRDQVNVGWSEGGGGAVIRELIEEAANMIENGSMVPL